MISDVSAVVWKEVRELLQGGSRGKFAPLVLLAIYGVFFPLQAGRRWVDSYQMLAFGLGISVFMVLSIVADTFAGERERHTLETLLASKLSDRSILIGKISAVVLYGWGLTMACLLTGLIAVNLKLGGGEILIYPAGRLVATVVMTLFFSILATGIGVLVSLRASTVRQAQQTLTLGWVALIFIVFFGVQLISPATRDHIIHRVESLSLTAAAIAAILLLLVLDVVVLAIDSVKFQRSRLILD
jgi:ABC-2 type transport system permease protein